MRLGTSYVDILNLLYLEFHAFKSNVESPAAVKSSNSIWGCCLELEIVPRFLLRRFCGNLESHDKMLLYVDCRSLSEILALSFVKIAILKKKWCSIKVKSRKTNKHYIYIFISVLFLDKLRIKWQSFKAIELEITKLFGFLERHTTHHLFQSSHLKKKEKKN